MVGRALAASLCAWLTLGPSRGGAQTTLRVPDTVVQVGRSVRVPILLPPHVVLTVQAIDLTLFYAPEGVEVVSVDNGVLRNCIVMHHADSGLLMISLACEHPQAIVGTVVGVTVRGRVSGKSALAIQSCELSRLVKGGEVKHQCAGSGGILTVPR